MDSNNPHWGWSWLERWMASRPWEELKPATEKDSKLSSPRKGRPPSRQSPSTPRSNARTLSTGTGRKLRSQSTKGGNVGTDEDLQRMCSIQSEKQQHKQSRHHRRHSIAESSVTDDDDSLASCSTSVPGYMTPTKSAKAKSRLSVSLTSETNGTPERRRSVATSTKKRLSFSGSPPTPSRRHSVPTKMEVKEHY